MCYSPNSEAVRAATYYHTRAWQMSDAGGGGGGGGGVLASPASLHCVLEQEHES